MRVLLVGGAGYIGGRLASFLKAHDHCVHVTSRRAPSSAPPWVAADRVLQVDPADGAALSAAMTGAEVVVHLAGADQWGAARDPLGTLRSAAETAWNVMEAAAAQASCPAVIYVSTFHVYGRNLAGTVTEATLPMPVHPYALAKHVGEKVIDMLRARGRVRALSVRLSNAFGAPAGPEISQWSLVFNDLCRQAATGGELVLRSSGSARRNFITMADAVRALEFLALRQEEWPGDGLMNVGSPLWLSIGEVAELVAARAEAVLGAKPAIRIGGGPDAPAPEPIFSIDRLAAMGFDWTNDVTREVDDTLRLCRSVVAR